ncbi:hypothetical protein VTN00DRAFT_10129 [Thermoascus crustaceus]|uniref:uncharacterized protein n=1 Tax=Thermoascus crustaceus TaxID=5088 RepID=UPI003742A5DD
MAAPADVTVQDLNGTWVMDKTLSTPTDPILKLQGISWITRKAISYATITLSISEYAEADPAADNKPIVHIDVEQTATGGIRGTTEKRVLSWVEREHSDHIFGNCVGQSRFVRGSKDENGKVRPDVDVQTKIGGNGVDDNTVRRFLRGEILPDGTETEGFLVEEAKEGDGVELGEGEGIWVQSWVKNKDVGWTAEQVWGFETINGERRYTRRVVVAKDGQYQLGRLVYTFLGRKE